MFWKKNKKRKQAKATNHGGGGEVLQISKNTKILKRVNRRVVGIGGDVTFDDGYSIDWAWRWRQNVSVGIQAKIPACFIIRAFPFESQLEPFLCLSLFRVDCIL